MSHEATVRRYYELVDAAEYDALVELFTEDVVYERPGQSTIEGREALRTFYEEGRPLSNGEHELHAVVSDSAEQRSAGNRTQSDDGDTVAVRGTFRGEQDSESVELGFADFHEFEDGAIARRYTYTDRDTV
ncbi:nuclear transport factor 2 family protein [Halolamina sp. CBA1230]|uniref:nuclear transport factor 2 family protein n=1 Tax=Halolamina sp. CBA1230 TaxID=1853690 RepID=UPI0009A2233B|nr:nuclear transport factor 2 family protein [Halolamina sp. CBA1230]QKY19907.1 nuclear transport factor 2 family protein [Halolamina sp. CBA1230]